jgi:hypothetical protein
LPSVRRCADSAPCLAAFAASCRNFASVMLKGNLLPFFHQCVDGSEWSYGLLASAANANTQSNVATIAIRGRCCASIGF